MWINIQQRICKNLGTCHLFGYSFCCRSLTLFLGLCFCTFHTVRAQLQPSDTIAIIERLVTKPDTLLRNTLPDTLSLKWSNLRDKPIDSVLFRNNPNRFKQELFNLLIRGDAGYSVRNRVPATNISMAASDGKIIRHIEFRNVDIFAPAVADTAYKSVNWFPKTVNTAHYHTRQRIMKRNLLLKSGEPLDVFLASENERLLRELSFIMDARFVPRAVEGSPDSVDLVLITQDKFPIGMEVEILKSSIAQIGVTHQNVLGFGNQFSILTYWDNQRTPQLGYSLSYSVSNLAGTFATGRVEYTDRWNQQSFLADLSRDFRTASFKNAGGIRFTKASALKSIQQIDTTLYLVPLRYTNTDIWAGHMFYTKVFDLKQRSGFYLTGRYNFYKNDEGPAEPDRFYPYQDKTQLLFSSGYSSQGFRKDNLIYTFGRTEDVPFGYLFDFTAGMEWGQFKNRPYFSTKAAYGRYLRHAGYVYTQLRFGTFLYQGDLEQGAFGAQIRYFSRLHEHSRFQSRNFITMEYLHGINRYAGEYIGIGNQEGIAGLYSPSMRGLNKLVLNMESVVFSPFYLLGFRFAFFGSLDLGVIAQNKPGFDDSRLFSGIGAGVRIRNDRLVFNTFVIKLSVYPGLPADETAQYLIVDGFPKSRFSDFFPHKPEIIDYQ